MQRGKNERIVRTKVLKKRREFRERFLERGNTRTSESKLTFKMPEAYRRNFKFCWHQIKSIKKFFLRFQQWNSEMVMDNSEGSEPCGKASCQVCDHIITTNTFTLKACLKVFKIQSRLLNCYSGKVLQLLRCKFCDDTLYVGKAKTKFRNQFNNYKSKHRSSRKGKHNVPQKHFHSHYAQDCHRGIDDWEVTLFEKYERHN